MVKFGKYLRNNAIEEWKSYYINYKALKQKINNITTRISVVSEVAESPTNLLEDILKDPSSIKSEEDNMLTKLYAIEPNGPLLKEFITMVGDEFKKVYVFFVSMEKELYVQMNSHLYRKDNLHTFTGQELFQEVESLCTTIFLARSLKKFINDNTTALKKIMKKFDKKFEKYFANVSIAYFSSKLFIQNSDLEYMLQYKVIDETNVLVEEMLKYISKAVRDNNDIKTDQQLSKNVHDKMDEIYSYVLLVDRKNLYQIKYKDWFYYIREGEKIIKNNTSVINSDVYNPLMSSPLVNDNLLLKLLSDVAVERLESSNKRMFFLNKLNIVLCFCHAFLYMFSISNIIPSLHNYIMYIYDDAHEEEATDQDYCFFALIWSIVPLGTILSIHIFDLFEEHHFRKSLLTSVALMLWGNILYVIYIGYNQLFIIILSRIIIGLGTNPLISKKYITQFVSKEYLPNVSLFYLAVKSLGLTLGPLVGYLLFSIPLKPKDSLIRFDPYTIMSWTGIILYGFMLLMIFILFTDPSQSYFKLNEDMEASEFDGYARNSEVSSIQGSCPLISTEEKKMISDIDSKLSEYNEKNKFTDTNLIPSNLHEITKREEQCCGYLGRSMLINCLLLLVSRSINEALIVVMALNINMKNQTYIHQDISVLVICLLTNSVLTFLAAKLISLRSHTRKFLIFVLLVTLACSTPLVIMDYTEETGWRLALTYILYLAEFLFTTLIELVSSNLISNIIPPKWKVFGLSYGIFINHTILFAQTIGAFFAFGIDEVTKHAHKDHDHEHGKIIYKIIKTLAPCSLGVSLILVLVNYKELRVKAISRIMRSSYKNKLGL